MLSMMFGLMLAMTTPAHAADDEGCWTGMTHDRVECLRVDGVEAKGDGKYTLRMTNRCTDRLYARFCLQYETGKWSCGASGIRGGDTKSWTTYNSNGKHFADAIGSNIPSKDWVCASKIGLEDEPE